MSDESDVSSSENCFKKLKKFRRQRSCSTLDNNPKNNLPFYKSYLEELQQRQRDAFTYSLTITILFQSCLALVALFYSIRASQEIKKRNFTASKLYIYRANSINLTALVMGSILFLFLLIGFLIHIMP